ncbi:MAG TPA: hypothetical protein VN031_02995 [Candidatus Microsaccharimonas sp.]|nr:hypothetical protein [Candidatus Microsaccharimonas sp.]
MSETPHTTPGQLDPTIIDQQRLAGLEQVPQGAQVVSPEASLYPIENIGNASTLPDGTKLNVIAELAIPNGGTVIDDEVVPQHRFMAVVSAQNQDKTAYALIGLQPDEQGNMRGIKTEQPVWLHGVGATAVIGRAASDDKIAASRLWNQDTYADDVSRRHLVFQVTEQGLQIENAGSNPTFGKTGEAPTRDEALDQTQPRNIELAKHAASDTAKKQEALRDDRLIDARETVANAHEQSTVASESNQTQQVETSEEDEWNLPKQAEAMQELQDSWGLAEEATPAEAIQKLDATNESLDKLMSLLSEDGNLKPALARMRQDIQNTFDTHMVHLNRNRLNDTLNDLDAVRTEMMLLNDYHVFMPHYAKQSYDQSVYELTNIGNVMSHLMPSEGFVDSDVAYDTMNLLHGNSFQTIEETTLRLKREIEEKRIDLMGYTAATAEKGAEYDEKFADDRIKELAQSLRREGVSEEDLTKAATAMERYLDDAIDSAPANGLKFSQRVLDNTEKLRSDGDKGGKKAPSRRVTAEIAVDILRGAFNIDKSNRTDDIVIDKNGQVETGHHRTAALMTLYGKNWLKVAEAQGFKIKQES